LLKKNFDFLHIGNNGLEILSLGKKEKKLIIDETTGLTWMLHPLQSFNFLKLSQNNYLLFECSKDNERVIRI
jgi:hypothetical protein